MARKIKTEDGTPIKIKTFWFRPIDLQNLQIIRETLGVKAETEALRASLKISAQRVGKK